LRILHVSADVPDPFNRAKTPVIARMIDLVADEFDHEILSINRKRPALFKAATVIMGTAPPVVPSGLQKFEIGTALEYLAPPNGLLHATMLERVGDWIAARCTQQPMLPDLVIGHKLTIEGIIAGRIASKLGIPYAITIQGNTDQKILTYRPDLRPRFARIFHDAACVFSFAPWAREAVGKRLGEREGPIIDLPCPTFHETIRSPKPAGSGFISVFHLRNHKIKNLDGLTKAMRVLAADGSNARLDIIGGGNAAQFAECKRRIARSPNIALIGERTQEELGPIMNGATALIVPSRRESFGLVYIEALFAGLPIIYPKGAGVDGYFDGLPFAISVDAKKPKEIAEAIRHVTAHEAEIKAALGNWQASGGLRRFTRAAIAEAFSQGLRAAVPTVQMSCR
jgi:glycosyltransferase involved in cell wall biosynthesis